MSSTEGNEAVITTFAGGPQTGPAVDVAESPVAVAAHGNVVYIADEHEAVVYRVDTGTGQQTIAAGTGVGGFSGDGGPATQAEADGPLESPRARPGRIGRRPGRN